MSAQIAADMTRFPADDILLAGDADEALCRYDGSAADVPGRPEFFQRSEAGRTVAGVSGGLYRRGSLRSPAASSSVGSQGVALALPNSGN